MTLPLGWLMRLDYNALEQTAGHILHNFPGRKMWRQNEPILKVFSH